MHQKALFLVLILSVLTGLVLPLRAIDLPSKGPAVEGRKMALLIGNAKYQKNPLTSPVNDVTAFGQVLSSLAFEVHVKTDLDLKSLNESVKDFAASLTPRDTVLVFFAGYGLAYRGINYLLPVDNGQIYSEADVRLKAYEAGNILDAINAKRVNHLVLILDSCRKVPLESNSSSTTGLAVMNGPGLTGTTIMYSSSPGMAAPEGSSHNSVFTSALIRESSTPGIPIMELFARVKQAVQVSTRGAQVPWIQISPGSGDIVLFSFEHRISQARTEQKAAESMLASQRVRIRALVPRNSRPLSLQERQKIAEELAREKAIEEKLRMDAEKATAELSRLEKESARRTEVLASRKRMADAEAVRLSVLAQVQETQPVIQAGLRRTSDSEKDFLGQLVTLENIQSGIEGRYSLLLQEGELTLEEAYFEKEGALKVLLEQEPWEDEKDFADRHIRELQKLFSDKAADLKLYRSRIDHARRAEESLVDGTIQTVYRQLGGRTFRRFESEVIVTVGDYDKTLKSWPVRLASTDPHMAFAVNLEYSIRNAGDQGRAWQEFSSLVRTGGLAGEIEYRYVPVPGTKSMDVIAQSVQLLDVSTGQVLLSGGEGLRLFSIPSRISGKLAEGTGLLAEIRKNE